MNEQLKRIILDIRELQKDPILDIHYYPCDEDITIGQALIFGPQGTPYEHGNYLFLFEFPVEYPYKPPKVTYCSNDGSTRFNPNFYRNGKVCLSLLNTWQGEQWSAVQSIRSILITLQMTMTSKPLLNEPGIEECNHYSYVSKYNKMIEYKNIELTIAHFNANPHSIPFQKEEIIKDIQEHFKHTKDQVLETISKKKGAVYNKTILQIPIYSQKIFIDYERVEKIINEIKLN